MSENPHEMTGRRQSDDIIIRLEQQFETLLEMVKEVRTALLGDGSKDNPGVLIRLDRLEQLESERHNHRTILYTATIGLIVERIFHYIRLLGSK